MKGPFAGGCIVGVIIGIAISCVGLSIGSFVFFRQVKHQQAMLFDRGNNCSMSRTTMLGQYEFADADAVKEFNSRVKKWFSERGFEELRNMPLRSLERKTTNRHIFHNYSHEGNWNMPGVLLLRKFDDQNSLYILVPDCYRRETHSQNLGYRIDLVGTPNKTREYEIQLDILIDDFERAFPEGNY